MAELRFTDVGEGLEEGELVAWLVAEGDVVQRFQPLVSVETDKSVVELPSPASGRVVRLHGVPGDVVRVGTLLVEIDDGGTASATAPEMPAAAAVSRPEPAVPGGRVRVRAAPAVRRLAVDLGVDLATVTPTGPDGRVAADDVHRAAEAVAGGPPAASSRPTPPRPALPVAAGGLAPGAHPLRGVRKRTAEVMAQSWATVPHITVMDEIDATALLAARDALRDELGPDAPRLTVLAFAALAVATALPRFPTLHASIDPAAGTFTVHPTVVLGIAVATGDGLLVPVLRDPLALGLRGVAAELERLAAAARARTLTPEEQRGATFTITNYGAFGGGFATPLVRPPEVGILGMGQVRERPFAVRGRVEARPTLPLVLSADHRMVDGDGGGGFLATVCRLLSEPARLLVA